MHLPCRWSEFDSRLRCFFLCCMFVFFFRFVFVVNHIFPVGLFPFILSPGPFEPREVFSLNAFQVMFYITLAHSSIVHALSIEISVNHLGSSESTQMKSQNVSRKSHLLKFHIRAAQICGLPAS